MIAGSSGSDTPTRARIRELVPGYTRAMLKRKAESLGYALRGLRIGLTEEPNFQIQLVCAAIAVILGLYFDISIGEWLFIIVACGLVLTAELLNTALEELCDMLKSTHDPHVAKIKDLAAGAVLVASFIALLTGLIIFVPRIFAL